MVLDLQRITLFPLPVAFQVLPPTPVFTMAEQKTSIE